MESIERAAHLTIDRFGLSAEQQVVAAVVNKLPLSEHLEIII